MRSIHRKRYTYRPRMCWLVHAQVTIGRFYRASRDELVGMPFAFGALMKVCILGVISGLLTAACGGVDVNAGDAGAADAASDSSNASDSRSGDAGMASIQIGNCQQLTPCGGDVVGTWAFASGCVDDPLAQSKTLCPTLQVNSETASASGTVTFTANLVTRSYQTNYAMDIVVPTACLFNQSCAQIQTAFRPYIPNSTCQAVSTGCGCTGSVSSAATQESPYTLANDEIVTAADHYAYCVTGSDMQYRHVAGPTTEIGAYHLTKQ
jgi:hypothetical protein